MRGSSGHRLQPVQFCKRRRGKQTSPVLCAAVLCLRSPHFLPALASIGFLIVASCLVLKFLSLCVLSCISSRRFDCFAPLHRPVSQVYFLCLLYADLMLCVIFCGCLRQVVTATVVFLLLNLIVCPGGPTSVWTSLPL